MADGRGSAVVVMAVLCLLAVVLQCEATTYTVGDNRGWYFGTSGWEKGKTFNAGDVLVFKYPPKAHNVAAVNQADYDACNNNPKDAPIYTSGNDQITLKKGLNSFICTIGGHCFFGMKIQIFIP